MTEADAPTRVSVIVPTRDRGDCLRQALASVRAVEAAGSDLELEVIVADNGSTDDTAAVAHAFGARLVRENKAGAAAARNTGLRVATGEFVAFLDDDDVWLPAHLRSQVALLRQKPHLGAVLGQALNTDFAMTSTSSPWPDHLRRDVFDHLLQLQPQLGATVVRRAVLRSVGPFDENLLSDEDWDWHLRLALRHEIGFVAVPCVLFRFRPIGSREELQWRRWPYVRRVLVRNVWRAALRMRVVPPHRLALVYLEHAGRAAGQFLRTAVAHSARGDSRAVRRNLIWAVRISPLHVWWAILRQAPVRSACATAIRSLHA